MSQLRIVEVMEPGVPNRERIAIQALSPCNTATFCLMLGHMHLDGTASPIKDNLLWFGHAFINQGDWIFVFTGPGQTSVTPIENSTNKLISIFWGKENTVFQNRATVPMLCQMGTVNLPPQPEAKPQAMLTNQTNQTNVWY